MIELHSQIAIIRPELFASRDEFGMRYCANKRKIGKMGGGEFIGASCESELQRLLRRCVMIKRSKDEVLTDLPPKRRKWVDIQGDLAKIEVLLRCQATSPKCRNDVPALRH